MTAGSTRRGRWRWSEISPRRVAGNLLRTGGIVGLLLGITDALRGAWNADLDPPLLAVSVLMLAVGVVALWRVKPAPWP